jgi:hypothetical protein
MPVRGERGVKDKGVKSRRSQEQRGPSQAPFFSEVNLRLENGESPWKI